MAYSVEEMQQSRRHNGEAAKHYGGSSKRIGKTGRMSMAIDSKAYFNAIDHNGGVNKDGTNIWHDPEFCKDMQRRHPECGVKYVPQNPCISMARMGASKRRNRFGVISFRKVYK